MSKSWAWGIGVGLFAALSVADFLQTYALIEGGPAHEANPVAAEWLARHGWVGLALFKGLVCLCVFAPVLMLARRKSPAAGRLLALGCGVLLAVGVYSRGLLVAEAKEAEWEAAAVAAGIVEVLPGEPNWTSRSRVPARLIEL